MLYYLRICIVSTCCEKSNIFFRIVKFSYQVLEKGTEVVHSSMHVTCAKVEKK